MTAAEQAPHPRAGPAQAASNQPVSSSVEIDKTPQFHWVDIDPLPPSPLYSNRRRALKTEADAALARILGTTTSEQANPSVQIQSLLEQGQQALQGRRFEAAIEAFDAVLVIDPENAEATQGRAQAVVGQRILGSRSPQR